MWKVTFLLLLCLVLIISDSTGFIRFRRRRRRPSPPAPTPFVGCKDLGRTFAVGASWNRSPCTSCTCVSTHNIQCRDKQRDCVHCTAGYTPVYSGGNCCPTCKPLTCTFNGTTYGHGAMFNGGGCKSCSCLSGLVTCAVAPCHFIPKCKPDHELKTLPGRCCPNCVRVGTCTYKENMYGNGATFRDGRCKYCSCINGKTICSTAVCPSTTCKPYEKLVSVPGGCCERCQGVASCTDENGEKHGLFSSWFHGTQFCVCVHGLAGKGEIYCH